MSVRFKEFTIQVAGPWCALRVDRVAVDLIAGLEIPRLKLIEDISDRLHRLYGFPQDRESWQAAHSIVIASTTDHPDRKKLTEDYEGGKILDRLFPIHIQALPPDPMKENQ